MSDGTIAGVHGLRVWIRWYTQEDLIPTYASVALYYPTYDNIVERHPTYADLEDFAGPPGVDEDTDVTCDVSGIHIERGRSTISDPVSAGVCTLTLNDSEGLYDPRTNLGTSRVGARITVEVEPYFAGEWFYLFFGFVETWSRRVSAEANGLVTATASDAMHLLARALDTPTDPPVGSGELSGARVTRHLNAAGMNPKWGTTAVEAGTVAMNPTDLSNDLLNETNKVAQSEDGLFDVMTDGTIRFRAEGWRDRHMVDRGGLEVALVDLTAQHLVDPLGRPVLCPTEFTASDDDLDVYNRILVARSVQYDPDLPDGSQPEVVWRKAENTQSAARIGIQSRSYDEMPHTSDGRSLTLAERWVERYSYGPNRIGDIGFNLVKRPEDAATVAIFDWGDRVLVIDRVNGEVVEHPYEIIGTVHNITPDDWSMVLGLDTWTGDVAPWDAARWGHAQWGVSKWVG